MVTSHRPSLVAALDSASTPLEIKMACLRNTEEQEAAAIQNSPRREEWVAGRIAAKYAFLDAEKFLDSEVRELSLRKLTLADLTSFAPEMYRSVSVVKDHARGGGPARVGWSSSEQNVQVAISHSAGISCASLSSAGIRSLDLETTAPRVPEFYRHTFTQGEREWVKRSSSTHGLHPQWLFTMLWSARECLLKTPAYAALSLWNMPSLEIGIHDDATRLVNAHDSKHLSGTFEFLQASSSRGPFQLAVAGAPNLILTAITGMD